VRYEVTPIKGSTRSGKLDADGWARLGGLDPGSCRVRFPDLDATEMEAD